MKTVKLTDEQIEELVRALECEGFDYAFVHYSDHKYIKDKEFHRLRKEFLKSREALENYVRKMLPEDVRDYLT